LESFGHNSTMWAFFIALVLFLFAFSRVRIVFFAEYVDGKLILKLSLGLAFGLIPLHAQVEYARGRVHYSLPWIEVEESFERFVEDISKAKKTIESGKIRFPIRRVLSRSHLAKFRLKSTIGVHNAATCALLCGLFQGALYALLAPFDWKAGAYPVIEVVPAFNRREFSLKLEGIAWFLPAQIIFEGNHNTSFNASAGG
jgi:hypothetical protein